ncbi:MAG: bifunctional hydroxymethylpyrimidine kinase/phosphomethylpyrimidine kinase [Chlorobiaceae bacterium]
MTKRYRTVLAIAGSDGSGGAGIQADIKTITANQCYALSVITAVTAQNTVGVDSTHLLDEKCITAQFRAIRRDIEIDAVKIGMLGSPGIIKTVASLLRELEGTPPVILDTPLGSSSGSMLLDPLALPILKEELFGLATLITPNIPEAALLTGMEEEPQTEEAIESAAKRLLATGPGAVLIKGGHGEGRECRDCLLSDNRYFWFSAAKIETGNTHGTGCTLSSAIGAFMARGESVVSAVEKAKSYTSEALMAGAGYRLGNGNGPLHHAYRLWQGFS